MNLDYYEVIITDRAGARKAWLTSSAPGGNPILEGAFDLVRNGGCKDFDFTAAKDRLLTAVEPGYMPQVGHLIAIYVKRTGSALTKYWTGTITKTPKLGTTRLALDYSCRGYFFAELQGVKIVKYYASADIDDMVTSILADIDSPVTAVSTSTSEIVIAAPYNVADGEFEYDPVPDVIKHLAEMQNDVQYGVDQNGKLYFKDLDLTDMAHYWVGKHIQKFEPEEDIDSVINHVIAQSKQAVGGGLLTIQDDDATSIAAYGTKTKRVEVRNTKDREDVARYAAGVISRNKDPQVAVDTELPTFSEFMFPRGRVRIIDKDGTQHRFPIQRVAYTLEKSGGLVGRMEIGAVPQPSVEDEYLEVTRRIERQGGSNLSLTKIVHTRGEEFAQEMVTHARKAGLLNHFIDPMSDAKVFNRAYSRHLTFRNNYNMGPFDFVNSNLFSNIIPLGRTDLTSIRIYTQFDHYGRINFDNDDDLGFFFEGRSGASPLGDDNVSDWRANEDGLGLEQFQNGGDRMFYVRRRNIVPAGQTGFRVEWPYKARFLYRALTAAADDNNFFFEYTASNDEYALIQINNTAAPGPTSMTVTLKKRVGGVTSTLESFNLPGDTDAIIEAVVDSAGDIQAFGYDVDGVAIDGTALHNFRGAQSDEFELAFSNFFSSGTIHARIGWFEIEQTGTGHLPIIRASKSGQYVPSSMFPPAGQGVNHGFDFHDIDISGDTSGDDLTVQLYMRHPKRLYGWGAAW